MGVVESDCPEQIRPGHHSIWRGGWFGIVLPPSAAFCSRTIWLALLESEAAQRPGARGNTYATPMEIARQAHGKHKGRCPNIAS